MSLATEFDLLAPKFKDALRAAVAAYRASGVRFALCGGLAAGAYGEPRATRDIDFLVGDEAFESTGMIVSFARPLPLNAAGIGIDAIPIPVGSKTEEALDECMIDDSLGFPVPILTPEGLAHMKLIARRPKDISDIVAMLDSGALTEERLRIAADSDPDLNQAAYRAIEAWKR